jgi:hypothetical protein
MSNSSDSTSTNAPRPPTLSIRIFTQIKRVFRAPLVLLERFGRGRSKVDEVVVFSAPPGFFLWIVIAIGFGLQGLISTGLSERAGAWLFIFTLLYFMLALLYDMNLKRLALWLLIIATLWLLGKYLEGLHHVAILGPILHHFTDLHPHYDQGTISALCWLLLIPWVASLFAMFFNRRKKFSPNEIAEFHFGEGSELTDRTGLRFVTKYRDVLETILGFGSGDVLAVDNHQVVIKRYENILGLWFKWDKLDRILHQRATLLDEENETAREKTAEADQLIS